MKTTYKKTLCAAEQRNDWQELPKWFDIKNLVFIDETWTKTNMTVRYGRSERGKRLSDDVPFGALANDNIFDCMTL